MEGQNYKQQDRERILSFISCQGGSALVEAIIERSGAEPLRVYPLLFDLRQVGLLAYEKEEEYGSPKRIRLVLVWILRSVCTSLPKKRRR